jgi:hypothetical protein
LTETTTTPDRDPDEEPVFVDEHGPAFRSPYFDISEEEYPERLYAPYEEPPDE